MSRYNVPRDHLKQYCFKKWATAESKIVYFPANVSWVNCPRCQIFDQTFTAFFVFSLFIPCILQSQMLHCMNMRICMRSLRWSKAAGQRQRSLLQMYVLPN